MIIHKPTHKFFTNRGTPALAIGQKRGSTLYLNLFDDCGKLIEQTRAIGTCADHLTGYGHGVCAVKWDSGEVKRRENEYMRNVWLHVFGPDVEMPVRCEKHERIV